jgi:TonB family protein
MLLVTLLAAAAAAAPAPLAPTTVSPLVIRPQPDKPPPADATVTLDSSDDAIDPQRVTVFPTHGLQRGATGRVTLTCLVDEHGLAERCRVAWESPQGYGFGAAALAQQALLKVKPKTVGGRPVAAEMNIALEFKAPVKDDNIGDLQKYCARCRGEIPGDLIRIAKTPLAMRHMVMMNHPVWLAAPTFDDLAAARPKAAGDREGYAVVHCGVNRRSGAPSGCFTAREEPVGRGFGAAALKLSAKFRVAPDVLAAAPHDGPVEVDIPIRFPPADELGVREVLAPAWLSGVDAGRAPRLFPPEAAARGLTSGRGVARCAVAADGTLTACAPGPAQPEGLGFSEAAAKLASTLRMNLWSADAQPVQGGVVEIAIRLNLAGQP